MDYREIVEQMPAGLDRAVLSILSKQTGVSNAVKKGELRQLLSQVGFRVKDERQIRLAISKLRKQGVLIGSTNSDGYFTIADRKEWDMVKNQELLARVKDITETVNIMDRAARAAFGDGWQEGLF